MNSHLKLLAGALIAILAAMLGACGAPAADSAIPSASPRGAPVLASTLPRELNGDEIPIFSMRGPEFVASAEADPKLLEFLDALDAELETVSVAFGFLTEPEIDLLALRVEGAGEQRLSREFRAVHALSGSPPMDWSEATAGGKKVLVAIFEGPDEEAYYLYVRGDTLYLVATPHPDLAELALARLP